MEKTSTTLKRKSVKQSKPSRQIIQSILNYSKSMVVMPTDFGKKIMIINN